jgi:DNA (cytosine-5)-methyltransferase 1
MKPRLLDLFCGAGGAAVGYHRAGFEVVGVDLSPQPRYPFEFHQADALTFPLDGFDVIHASPPCQGYTWGTRKGREDRWPLMIGDVRERLTETGAPFVIENVPNARHDMREPVLLCGAMFGLQVNRHRLFESPVDLWPQPGHPRCAGRIASGEAVTVAGHGGDSKDFRIARWQEAMGIDWTRDRHELAEAIPPAYTEWIGHQLIAALPK